MRTQTLMGARRHGQTVSLDHPWPDKFSFFDHITGANFGSWPVTTITFWILTSLENKNFFWPTLEKVLRAPLQTLMCTCTNSLIHPRARIWTHVYKCTHTYYARRYPYTQYTHVSVIDIGQSCWYFGISIILYCCPNSHSTICWWSSSCVTIFTFIYLVIEVIFNSFSFFLITKFNSFGVCQQVVSNIFLCRLWKYA